MIKQKITVRNITANYKFSGSPLKKWFCEIVNSNLGTDGNPIVNYVNNGFINLTCLPRQLNATIDVIFHEESESEEVEKLEAVINITSIFPKWSLDALGRLAFYLKRIAVAILVFIVLSITFAILNYYFNITGFLDEYQKYNAANGSRVLEKTVKRIVKRLDDPFYETEGVKVIEEDLNISYKSMFTSVDEDLYIMKNVFVDSDGNAILMTHGQAEDKCDALGGYILPLKIQQEILPQKSYITVRRWSDQSEWTGTARGLFSDDYVINLKDGGLIEGTYNKDGLIYGDSEDVKIAVRCGVLRATFIEEN